MNLLNTDKWLFIGFFDDFYTLLQFLYTPFKISLMQTAYIIQITGLISIGIFSIILATLLHRGLICVVGLVSLQDWN